MLTAEETSGQQGHVYSLSDFPLFSCPSSITNTAQSLSQQPLWGTPGEELKLSARQGDLISEQKPPRSLSSPPTATLTFRSRKSPELASEEFLLWGPDDSGSSLPPLHLAPEAKDTFLRNVIEDLRQTLS